MPSKSHELFNQAGNTKLHRMEFFVFANFLTSADRLHAQDSSCVVKVNQTWASEAKDLWVS